MKRYELAKRQGLNWQVVLLSDAETDIKTLTRDCVLRGDSLSEVNRRVNTLIGNVIKTLESAALKEKVKRSFPVFASRLYYYWLTVFGTRALGVAFIAALKVKKIPTPPTVKQALDKLPVLSELAFSENIDPKRYNRASPNAIYNKEYERQVRERINKISDMTAKENYSAKYSLRAAAELQLRAEWHETQLSSMRKNGVRLCWIDSHANCSERCEKWQGKLYSLDGTSGTVDGVEYEPIENAMNEVDEYGYKNGCLSGFNCRHKTIPYRKGFRPQEAPASVVDKQRELEKQQRYMERTVRRYETRALMFKGLDKVMYRHCKAKAKEWTERYESFSMKNKIPFYPSRLDV